MDQINAGEELEQYEVLRELLRINVHIGDTEVFLQTLKRVNGKVSLEYLQKLYVKALAMYGPEYKAQTKLLQEWEW